MATSNADRVQQVGLPACRRRQGPGSLPSGFQPPAHMPKIDFSAPVIRLGTTGPLAKPSGPGGPGGRKESLSDPMSSYAGGRPGLGAGHGGMDQQRQAMRESIMSLAPPTKDEIVRTIFVGSLTDDVSDMQVERILRSAGNLRRWHRATDADGKQCRFGFAEYDDPESLGTAVEVLKEVQVPRTRKERNGSTDDEGVEEVEHTKLLIVVDENSLNYLEHYQSSRADEDPAQAQARLDNARSTLAAALADMANPTVDDQDHEAPLDGDGDSHMRDGERADGLPAEIVTIPLTIDDELADIPAEMRETVAQEIAAFRDRSNRRDMERLKREEELESMERSRNLGPPRGGRMASPTLQAPTGPAGGANGIPLGPRDRGVQGAPSGPKGFHGQQIPRDYQRGVAFVNGSGLNGAGGGWINREDEDSDASDEELERRRKERQEAEREKLYLEQELRWLNRERSRTAAMEREMAREAQDEVRREHEKKVVATRFREWDDDVEASRKGEDYYLDRSLWVRNRATFRQRELEMDERDRTAELREHAKDEEKREEARGMADQFLARQAQELEQHGGLAREPARFRLSLGAAAQKAQAAQQPRRTVAEVEGLLEDEEEGSGTAKRTLVPITLDTAADGPGSAAHLTPEERNEAVRQLAAEIPSDRDGLWAWSVRWEYVDEAVIKEKLQPFVEKKIVEYLGVQEQMLVEVVEEHVRKRGSPGDLVKELEGAMEDEAEALVKKLWRMIIFFSESEKRGLSA
ncbi:MAG: hypothetical protein M1838_001121 [Thelocarpon superellum]|nr:MAG: hypothetical protein M1838_001121 [Thelocarpon superellum]